MNHILQVAPIDAKGISQVSASTGCSYTWCHPEHNLTGNSRQDKETLSHHICLATPVNICHIQHFPDTTVEVSFSLAHWKGSAALHHGRYSSASCIPSGFLEIRENPSVKYMKGSCYNANTTVMPNVCY